MIKISERFYIDADANCYTLKEKVVIKDETSKNYGKETFEGRKYYSTLDACLEGILKIQTREFISKEEINSVKELKDEIIAQKEFIKSLNLDI